MSKKEDGTKGNLTSAINIINSSHYYINHNDRKFSNKVNRTTYDNEGEKGEERSVSQAELDLQYLLSNQLNTNVDKDFASLSSIEVLQKRFQKEEECEENSPKKKFKLSLPSSPSPTILLSKRGG